MQDIPAIVVAAKSLPKDAMIEVQVLAHSNRHPTINDDEDEGAETLSGQVETKSNKFEHLELKIRTACDGSSFSVVLARNGGESRRHSDCVLTFPINV
jgi:hypothetical protein